MLSALYSSVPQSSIDVQNLGDTFLPYDEHVQCSMFFLHVS